jgi:hypothetical protein
MEAEDYIGRKVVCVAPSGPPFEHGEIYTIFKIRENKDFPDNRGGNCPYFVSVDPDYRVMPGLLLSRFHLLPPEPE